MKCVATDEQKVSHHLAEGYTMVGTEGLLTAPHFGWGHRKQKISLN